MTSPNLSLRDAQKALTRGRIVDAARTVFEREGYSGASIGLIANEAAINRATFYLHFPEKSAVFREVVAHDRMHLIEYWSELNKALVTGTREAIEKWIARMKRWYTDNALLMPSKHEAMASDPHFAIDFQPRYDRLAVEISEYLEQFDEDRRGDEKIRIQTLVVMTDQMFFHAYVQGVWKGPQQQLRTVITDIWCRTLNFS